MTLQQLEELISSGRFHHATYRNDGTLWHGLHIYAKKDDGFRGYEHCGIFGAADPDLDAAFEMTRPTGISVGAYGEG